MLWDLLLRYSLCWGFVFHYIQKYHTIWTRCQRYLEKRRVVERWCDCCLRKRRAVSRPRAYCLERRRVDQRPCAYCLRKRSTGSRCRACSERKRRAKRCAFDGCFLCRSMRFCLGMGQDTKKAERTYLRCVPPKSNVIKVVTKSRVYEKLFWIYWVII